MIQLLLSGVNHPRIPSDLSIAFLHLAIASTLCNVLFDYSPYHKEPSILFKMLTDILNLKNTLLERTTQIPLCLKKNGHHSLLGGHIFLNLPHYWLMHLQLNVGSRHVFFK